MSYFRISDLSLQFLEGHRKSEDHKEKRSNFYKMLFLSNMSIVKSYETELNPCKPKLVSLLDFMGGKLHLEHFLFQFFGGFFSGLQHDGAVWLQGLLLQ